MRKFRWLDAVFFLVPGILAVWFSYSALGLHESEAQEFLTGMSLYGYCLYALAYMVARLVVPPSVHLGVAGGVAPFAVFAFVVGGLSLAAGYHILTFAAAPLIGAFFGALFVPGRRAESPPTDMLDTIPQGGPDRHVRRGRPRARRLG